VDFKKFLFMAGALTHDKRFAPLAVKALEEYYASPEGQSRAPSDGSYVVNDPEIEIYMALARLADPASVEPLQKFYKSGDDDTRELVVHAIGAVESPEAEAFLVEALKTGESVNVTWNPDYVKSAPNIRDKQVVDWLATGAMAAATMGDQDFKAPLEKLAKNPQPAVANAARKALEHLASLAAAAPAEQPKPSEAE
jgi:HEAT repeat protein